jgi:hypothetical protein
MLTRVTEGQAKINVYNDLDHGVSGIRIYMMELAWIIRKQLQVGKAADHLLQNVAGTLAYVDHSAGLCYCLFDSEASFWNYADAFTPQSRFEEQYRQRLEAVRNAGVSVCTQYFWRFEAGLRKKIEDFALRLT